MIEYLVSKLFDELGHEWKIGDSLQVPTEDDVRRVLDKAVETLYDRDVGTRLETGGLIIEKREHGFEVYCYLGNYI